MRFTCTKYYNRIQYYRITGNQTITNNNKPPRETKTPNYKIINQSKKEIIKQHKTFLNKHNIPTKSDKLPYTYTIFKSHKIGSRGVTSNCNVTTTILGKTPHQALNLITKQIKIKNQNKKINNNISKAWMINNSNDLTEILEKLNYTTKPKYLQSYDVEGFYDNIDIKKLEKIITILIPKAFKDIRRKYINVNLNKKTATWSNNKITNNKNIITLTKEKLIKLQKWHLNNTIIKYNNNIYKQTNGIGQGTNQSPDLANLTLYYYKNKFMKYHTKNNINIAKTFTNTTRKMDNILFINNNIAKEWIYKNKTNPHGLYPSKYFNLTTEQEQPTIQVDYLDVNIHIIKTPSHLKNDNYEKYKI